MESDRGLKQVPAALGAGGMLQEQGLLVVEVHGWGKGPLLSGRPKTQVAHLIRCPIKPTAFLPDDYGSSCPEVHQTYLGHHI